MTSKEDRQAVIGLEKTLAFEITNFVSDRLSIEQPGATAPDLIVMIAIAHVSGLLIAKADQPAIRLAWFLDTVKKAVDLESDP